jgi:hypothetical protein
MSGYDAAQGQYQIFHAVCVDKRSPSIPSAAHSEVATLLRKCLTWEREARPTAFDVVEELLQIQARLSTLSRDFLGVKRCPFHSGPMCPNNTLMISAFLFPLVQERLHLVAKQSRPAPSPASIQDDDVWKITSQSERSSEPIDCSSMPQLPLSCKLDVNSILWADNGISGPITVDPSSISSMARLGKSRPESEYNDFMFKLVCRLSQHSTYVLQEVDDNGHCQFDALAHQLAYRFRADYPEKDQATYWTVRQDLAGWLQVHGDLVLDNGASLASFLEARDGVDWPAFCAAVAGEGQRGNANLWGNHLTLVAAANCYGRPVRVWTALEGPQWWFEVLPLHENCVFEAPFELAHLSERHYLSVTEPRFALPERVSGRKGGAAHDVDLDPLLTRVWDACEFDGPPIEQDLSTGDFCMRNCVCCTLLPPTIYAQVASYFACQWFSRQDVLYEMVRESREEDLDGASGAADYSSWWGLAFHDWCWVPGTRGHPCYCVADLVFCSGAAPCAGMRRLATKIKRDILRIRQLQYLMSVVIGPFLSVMEVSMSAAAVGRCDKIELYIYLAFVLAAWVAAWLAGWRLGGRTRWSACCLAAWVVVRLAAGLDYPGGLLWQARITYAWIEPDRGLLAAAVPANATAETRPLFEQAAMREALAECQA